MPKFRKKPVVIEAWQWNGSEDDPGVCARCPMSDEQKVRRAHLHTVHQGQMVELAIGDWIIPEPDGEHFYPCKPDIFAATYEPVEAMEGG